MIKELDMYGLSGDGYIPMLQKKINEIINALNKLEKKK